MSTRDERFRYKFSVIGRSSAHPREKESSVTLVMLAGPDDCLSYCGTLTMSEAEWDELRRHLTRTLKDALEIDDRASVKRAG